MAVGADSCETLPPRRILVILSVLAPRFSTSKSTKLISSGSPRKQASKADSNPAEAKARALGDGLLRGAAMVAGKRQMHGTGNRYGPTSLSSHLSR